MRSHCAEFRLIPYVVIATGIALWFVAVYLTTYDGGPLLTFLKGVLLFFFYGVLAISTVVSIVCALSRVSVTKVTTGVGLTIIALALVGLFVVRLPKDVIPPILATGVIVFLTAVIIGFSQRNRSSPSSERR